MRGDRLALVNDVLLPLGLACLSPTSILIELIDTAHRFLVGDEFSVSLGDDTFVDSFEEFFETGV